MRVKSDRHLRSSRVARTQRPMPTWQDGAAYLEAAACRGSVQRQRIGEEKVSACKEAAAAFCGGGAQQRRDPEAKTRKRASKMRRRAGAKVELRLERQKSSWRKSQASRTQGFSKKLVSARRQKALGKMDDAERSDTVFKLGGARTGSATIASAVSGARRRAAVPPHRLQSGMDATRRNQ